MNLSNSFIKKFGSNLSQNVNLSHYSWFNLGGDAEFFFKPNDESWGIRNFTVWIVSCNYPCLSCLSKVDPCIINKLIYKVNFVNL